MPGGFMVVGDSYIRRHIIPGGIDAVYGQNTYYGQKVLFRAHTGEMYVATVPARNYVANPQPTDIHRLSLP